MVERMRVRAVADESPLVMPGVLERLDHEAEEGRPGAQRGPCGGVEQPLLERDDCTLDLTQPAEHPRPRPQSP